MQDSFTIKEVRDWVDDVRFQIAIQILGGAADLLEGGKESVDDAIGSVKAKEWERALSDVHSAHSSLDQTRALTSIAMSVIGESNDKKTPGFKRVMRESEGLRKKSISLLNRAGDLQDKALDAMIG